MGGSDTLTCTCFTLQASQGRQDWDAPELAWGEHARGRVLGEPDMIYFRYRAPADEWEGNPANAPCYDTPEANQPLAPRALGGFTPELARCSFASLDEFMSADACGPLRKPTSAAAEPRGFD